MDLNTFRHVLERLASATTIRKILRKRSNHDQLAQLEFLEWTLVNVKLLLPPRQSRGTPCTLEFRMAEVPPTCDTDLSAII